MMTEYYKNRASLVALSLALTSSLAGCTQQPSSTVTPTPVAAATSAVVATSSPQVVNREPLRLFDGREPSDQWTRRAPNPQERDMVAAEVKRASVEPELQRLAGPGQTAPNSDNFQVVEGAVGSFTQPGSKQELFLYRYGQANGLVITEGQIVVAHYGGRAGDYALFTHMVPADVNGDGLTDLILLANVEDNKDINAYLFEMTPGGPQCSGKALVFSSSVQGGQETDPKKTEETAYELLQSPDQPSTYTEAEFKRVGRGEWKQQGQARPFTWHNTAKIEPIFENLMPNLIDPARLKGAIAKLDSYADVPSSIDYANPKNEAQQLVATDPTLQLMEMLDTRAAVYAVENAGKQQVDHSEVGKYSLTLDGLTTQEQIENAYIQHTNESLGGESPYGRR